MWLDDEPLIHPRHRVLFFQKKGTNYNLPPPPKYRRQRKTCTRTEQKCSHNTHTQLSSFHTNQKCRDGDMIHVGQINKNITEKLGGIKIKGPFLEMLPQLPPCFLAILYPVFLLILTTSKNATKLGLVC